MNEITILGYVVLCFVVAAVAKRFLRTIWVYFLVAATLPPMFLIAADVLFRGHLDAWADIAFIVAWLIGLGCAAAYFAVMQLTGRKDLSKGKPEQPTPL